MDERWYLCCPLLVTFLFYGNQVDGYFLFWKKYLTLPNDWKRVQLIDLIAQQITKSCFLQ